MDLTEIDRLRREIELTNQDCGRHLQAMMDCLARNEAASQRLNELLTMPDDVAGQSGPPPTP